MEFPSVGLILAAGKGTRMGSLCEYKPKPLLEVAGKSLLEWQVLNFNACGIKKIGINVHHLSEMMLPSIHKLILLYPHIQFKVSLESKEILGQAGGINNLISEFPDDAFFLSSNTDVFIKLKKLPLSQDLISLWVIPQKQSNEPFSTIYFHDQNFEIRKCPDQLNGFFYTGFMAIHKKYFTHMKKDTVYHVVENLWKPNSNKLFPIVYKNTCLDLGEESKFKNNKKSLNFILGN